MADVIEKQWYDAKQEYICPATKVHARQIEHQLYLFIGYILIRCIQAC